MLRIKKITKIYSTGKRFLNKGRKLNLLNYLLFPNPNVSSLLSDNQNKFEEPNQESRRTQRYNININNISEKHDELIKTKKLFFSNNNNYNFSINNNSKLIKGKLNKYIIHKTDDNNKDDINNYEKYIKSTLGSFKIKKEISSFLYTTPEKQQRIISYISSKLNKLNNIPKRNNSKININCKTARKIKVRKRIITDEYINEYKEEKENDKDEDKTNLREFNLFSSIKDNENKNIKSKKLKYMRNNDQRYIECWDNNLLKFILSQNLNNQCELNTYAYNLPKKEMNTPNLKMIYNLNKQLPIYRSNYESYNISRTTNNSNNSYVKKDQISSRRLTRYSTRASLNNS